MFDYQTPMDKQLEEAKDKRETTRANVSAELWKLVDGDADKFRVVYQLLLDHQMAVEAVAELRPNWYVQYQVDQVVTDLALYGNLHWAVRDLLKLRWAGYSVELPTYAPSWLTTIEDEYKSATERRYGTAKEGTEQ